MRGGLKRSHRTIVAFKFWCWRRLLRVPWTARKSNQSILKEINPEYSLEGLMLKLKLQYFGYLMWRADSLEKTLMLQKTLGQEEKGATEDEMVGWYCCRNRYLRNQAPHSESWRTQVYYAGGSTGVNSYSSEPKTTGLQSFYRQCTTPDFSGQRWLLIG